MKRDSELRHQTINLEFGSLVSLTKKENGYLLPGRFLKISDASSP